MMDGEAAFRAWIEAQRAEDEAGRLADRVLEASLTARGNRLPLAGGIAAVLFVVLRSLLHVAWLAAS